MRKIFDETTRKFVNISNSRPVGLLFGIVYVNDSYIEYGYFSEAKNPVYIKVMDREGEERRVICFDFDAIKDFLLFSKCQGCYYVKGQLNPKQRIYHTVIKGNGDFPYSFPRMYEAADNFSIFKGKQQVEHPTHFTLSDYMPYTFGLEFETSMGYVPEGRCFKDGLIPLRDGSISGLEYSTVVLEGDSGLSLLFNQQIDDLKTYTEFNKECSLHVHMGGYPVTPKHIFALFTLCRNLEYWFTTCLPPDTFHTSKYKASGKDYCKPLPRLKSFKDLYEWLTGTPFFGSLTQAHPCDIGKIAKWKIHQRYLWLNLINMVCYSGPKTVEFRFLRPTFNKRIIMLWLWIFNAILRVAEIEANNTTDGLPLVDTSFRGLLQLTTIEDVIHSAYPREIADKVEHELWLYTMGVTNQVTNGDTHGRDIGILDGILTGDSPLL